MLWEKEAPTPPKGGWGLKRQVIDVEVEVKFKRRAYNGKQKGDTKRFRLVATYNVEEGKYHLYITNITVDRLDAEDIAVLYSATLVIG